MSSSPAPSGADEHRCWICLEDEASEHGMIAPCECVGTNQYVHKGCLETYCLQSLARRPSSTLSVSCPICLAEYRIVERDAAATLPWRDLLRVASTDQQLLLRHCHFLLLLLPLLVSCLLTWTWLLTHWWDVYQNGTGPPLLVSPRRSFVQQHVPALQGALAWLPAHLSELIKSVVQSVWDVTESAVDSPGDAADGADEAGNPHPAGISHKWSLLYVWLQCAQWYKVLSWLLIIVLGGSDGLLPTSARQVFCIEELLLASEARAQLFVFGQAGPFVLCKMRHFFVTWADSYRVVQLAFYACFTSYVEVTLTVAIDSIVAFALLCDWFANIATDIRLRLNLNKIRCGALTVAPMRQGQSTRRQSHTSRRPHAE